MPRERAILGGFFLFEDRGHLADGDVGAPQTSLWLHLDSEKVWCARSGRRYDIIH
jgi:hypothetical protein